MSRALPVTSYQLHVYKLHVSSHKLQARHELQATGLATSQAFAPTATAVARLDEYVEFTLYGTKPSKSARTQNGMGKAQSPFNSCMNTIM